MNFKSKAALKKENLELQLEIRELRDKVYNKCSNIGCCFCEHGLIQKNNGNMKVCCELTQSEYCKDFVKKNVQV